MWQRLAAVTFFLILFFSVQGFAQEHWALSGSTAYAAAIQKFQSRTVPKRYASASEQKMFAAHVSRKNAFLAQQLAADEVIQEKASLQRFTAILQRMQHARPDLPFSQVQVFVHRSGEANACCFGEGTLFINIGLLLQLENDDELAFLMGHELAHQFLGHGDSSLSQQIALAHSSDLKKEVKAIRKSSEDRLERLRSLKKRLAEVQGDYNRRQEMSADSMGILLAKQAGYDAEKAAVLLLRLDASDELLTGVNLYDLQKVFGPALPDYGFAQKPRYAGLSGVQVKLNADAELDSLRKSHPDCMVRYEHLQPGTKISGKYSPISLLRTPTAAKEQLLKEQVRYYFENDQLSLAVHYAVLSLELGYSKDFFRNFLSATCARLYAADKEGKRFEVVTTYSFPGSTLQKTQNFLSALSRAQLAALSSAFMTPSNTPSEAFAFAQLAQAVCIGEKPFEEALKTYQQQFPQPVMAYLLQPSGLSRPN